MSGETYTYVSLREDLVADLERKARRADALESQRRLLERQQREREEQARRLRKRMAANEERYERHVRSLGEEMRALEQTTRDRLDEQRRRYERGLQAQQAYTDNQFKTLEQQVREDLTRQREEYLGLFEQQARSFDEALKQQGASLQANIDRLAESMRLRLQDEQAVAEAWLENLARELDFMRERYRHARFAPEKMEQLEQRLDLARANLAQGLYQAAIAGAQDAFLGARQLREQLELQELHWEHVRLAARESTTAALLLLDEHKRVQYELGSDMTLAVEVDYWTDGRYEAVRKRLAEMDAQTAAPGSMMDVGGLESLRAEAEEAQDEVISLVAKARNAALSSIQRRDLQEMILERLGQLGFQHVDSTYEFGDARRGYHLKLRNGNGEEMVTIVAPAGDDFANSVTFDFFDNSPNEQVREQRLELIREQLEAEGELTVGEMKCDPTYVASNAPEERRDFARIKSKVQVVGPDRPE